VIGEEGAMVTKYRVVVQYGRLKDQTYACVPALDSAKKLRQTAIGLGYRDAFIQEIEVPERAAGVAQKAKEDGTGAPRPEGSHSEGRGVSNMRPQPETAMEIET